MLQYLHIKDFAVVETMEVNLQSGLNIITGGSGAGKSIIIKAIGLALGNKGSADLVRTDKKQLEVCTHFDIKENIAIKNILSERDISVEDELHIKRVICANGRSRTYINDQPVSVSLIKLISDKLININSQFQTQSLQKNSAQLDLLDAFGGHKNTLKKMQEAFKKYKSLCDRKKLIEESNCNNIQLLEYQVKELEEFSPELNEYERINKEHTKLSSSHEIEEKLNKVQHNISDESTGLQSKVHQCLTDIEKIKDVLSSEVANAEEILNQCNILLCEANDEINNILFSVDNDPEKLHEIDTRISMFHTLSRKHGIEPPFLAQHYIDIKNQLEKYNNDKSELENLEKEIKESYESCLEIAKSLHNLRLKSKSTLEKNILKYLSSLDLGHVKIGINLSENNSISDTGFSSIDFMISTNPGQELQPLSKIASGGELARVSLAITAATANKINIPVTVFDEIDTGVSGKAAALVGECIHKLSYNSQIICITHHPNVAAQPGTHWHIEKKSSKNSTSSKIQQLSDKERPLTVAQLISHEKVNNEALAHAEHLLSGSSTS
jgi:DNA repair protein RecN (Recombination protein N)